MLEEKKPKPRRLKAIAAWINENADLLGMTAKVTRTWVNTDRPPPRGLRYRTHTGKGREGNLLEVRATRTIEADGPYGPYKVVKGELVKSHNAAKTYSRNDEVERWLARYVKTLPAAVRRKLGPDATAWATRW